MHVEMLGSAPRVVSDGPPFNAGLTAIALGERRKRLGFPRVHALSLGSIEQRPEQARHQKHPASPFTAEILEDHRRDDMMAVRIARTFPSLMPLFLHCHDNAEEDERASAGRSAPESKHRPRRSTQA